MGKMLVPNDGVRGIDIKTERGVTKYDADRAGRIIVSDPKHAKSLRENGFTVAADAAGFGGEDHRCTGCGFNSVFSIYTCPKCDTKNDFTE